MVMVSVWSWWWLLFLSGGGLLVLEFSGQNTIFLAFSHYHGNHFAKFLAHVLS